MTNVFEKMYDNEIFPSPSLLLQREAYRKANDLFMQEYDSFEEKLPKEGKRLLDNLVDRMAEVNDLYCKEVYRQGIILGIDMMIDALVCDEDDEKKTKKVVLVITFF